MENMEIWNKVRTPDPKYTKEFNRGGGFKGSATNTQYSVQRATEMWGPNGTGWGVVITDEKYVPGAPIIIDGASICNETIHVIRGFVWYTVDGDRKESSEQFGQTVFVGKNKYGVFTDEEAPKKSVSDMMLKCLSLLGFSADIFLGLWDDNKYVNDVRDRVEEEKRKDIPLITEAQANTIYAMMDAADLRADVRSSFLKYVGVNSVEGISSDKYKNAVSALEAKIKSMGKP
jgi:hypothetical protein